MNTKNDTQKPETELKQEAGEGCSGATCSAFVPWERYVPGDKAADIWLKLHDTIGNNVETNDALNTDERSLYNVLTNLFTADFSMVGYSVAEYENPPPNAIAQTREKGQANEK